MTASAIVMMVVGMCILWGGLAASITHAVRTSKRNAVVQQNDIAG